MEAMINDDILREKFGYRLVGSGVVIVLGKYSFHINPDGSRLYKKHFDWCSEFRKDGTANVSRNEVWFFINKNGERVTEIDRDEFLFGLDWWEKFKKSKTTTNELIKQVEWSVQRVIKAALEESGLLPLSFVFNILATEIGSAEIFQTLFHWIKRKQCSSDGIWIYFPTLTEK